MQIRRLDRIADLTAPASLGAVSVREEPLSTVGFSGATHRRIVAVLPAAGTRVPMWGGSTDMLVRVDGRR